MELSLWGATIYLSVFYVVYNVALIVYRLYFHPLAAYPGPRWAAVTFWYECYQDIFAGQGGEFTNQIEEMHSKHGPIVRVTPDEVHVRDSEWSHVLYAGAGAVRDKDSMLAHAAGTSDGTFGTVSHHIHKRRRKPVSSYFSKTSVVRLQDKIWEHTEHMARVLEGHFKASTVARGRAIFLGWSNDTLKDAAFDGCLNLLDKPGEAMVFDRVFKAFARVYPITKQCEWIIPTVMKVPVNILHYIYPPLATLMAVHVDMIREAKRTHQEYDDAQEDLKTATDEKARIERSAHSLFHALLLSGMPEEEKQAARMAHEGFEVLLAGSDTSARAMGLAVYHILANKDIETRLREELTEAIPNPHARVSLKKLEELPWLSSIIKEVLRIGKVTDHRLTLVAPEETLYYGDSLIPAGTRISMTPTRNSYDTKFFPNPSDFLPQRWLQDAQTVTKMNHVYMPFAASRRGCLGMHFALAELYIGLACMFRRFEFELFDTERMRDIEHTWAHISGEPSKSGKGLRFKVISSL